MLWEQLKALPVTRSEGTEAKATKGAAVDGETNGRGNVAAKRRGWHLQKPFRVLLRLPFPPGARWKFCQHSRVPPSPCALGVHEKRPLEKGVWVPQMPTRAPSTLPGTTPLSAPTQCQAADLRPWKDRQTTTPPGAVERSQELERHKQGPPRGTYLQTFLPSGSSSWAELCTHSHSWRQRMGRALPIPAQVPAAPQSRAGVRLSRPVPSLLWCGLFLPPALGFFLRKRGRRHPDPDVRGAAGKGRQGMLPRGLFLALAATPAAEMGVRGLSAATQGLVPA